MRHPTRNPFPRNLRVDVDHGRNGRETMDAREGGGSVPIMRPYHRAPCGTPNLKKTFDATNVAGLGTLAGKIPKETWTFEVEDQERAAICSFGVELTFR